MCRQPGQRRAPTRSWAPTRVRPMSTVGRPTAAHACSTPCASKATGSVVAGCAGSCANRACRLMCPGGPPYDRQPARAAHRPKPAGRTNLGPGAGPLDFDSTVFLLRRKAGGPCKRFTPPGTRAQQPSSTAGGAGRGAQFVLHGWLRRVNTGAARPSSIRRWRFCQRSLAAQGARRQGLL